MRILQVISSIGYYGAENVVANLAQELQAQGAESYVCVITRMEKQDEAIAEAIAAHGIRVFHLPCRGRLDWKVIASMRQLIQQYGFEVIHSHNYKSNLYSYMAARELRIPLVATCHNWSSRTANLRAYALMDFLLLRAFQRVVAVSNNVASKLHCVGIKKNRLVEIANGIDVAAFQYPRPTFPAEGHEITIGTVCRLVREKGVENLLHASAALLREGHNIRLLVAGDGPDRVLFENRATSLGISSRVCFVGFQQDMPGVYASMDIFVLASRNEGMPLCVLEAMASGKPIVASRVGNLPELLKDGSGLLVQPAEPGELFGALKRLLQDPNLRLLQGEQGRRKVLESFSCEQMARTYHTIYKDELQLHPSREYKDAHDGSFVKKRE